ncbi:topoisomerase [Streptomyces sp. NPDC056638]|uniref:topoisomerase n=1 Tax=Streptomyces sp. NPDC056638 TaxID=3345887 RepID=UPI0036C7FFE7
MYPGSPAEEYVTARGLDDSVSARFGLGYVHSALPGHERYRGYLAVPYMRPAGGVHGVATVRYRCIADRCVKAPDGRYFFQHDQKERHSEFHPKSGKYLTVPGDVPRLFNTGALIKKSPYVVLVEGEFDTMVWDSIGIPCVGAPGAGSWRNYWLPAFLGYKTVYLVAEDGPGETFMDDLAAKMPNGRSMRMADDMDSNQIFLKYGAQSLKERLSL